jgi:hypothetical protein
MLSLARLHFIFPSFFVRLLLLFCFVSFFRYFYSSLISRRYYFLPLMLLSLLAFLFFRVSILSVIAILLLYFSCTLPLHQPHMFLPFLPYLLIILSCFLSFYPIFHSSSHYPSFLSYPHPHRFLPFRHFFLVPSCFLFLSFLLLIVACSFPFCSISSSSFLPPFLSFLSFVILH